MERTHAAPPEQVTWDPGQPGVWLRNFRFGEWLAGPVSPLFESWALAGMERRLDDIYESWIGIRPPPPTHVVVNGWYFYGFNPVPAGWLKLITAVALHILPSFVRRPRRAALLFPPLARFGVELAYREFRDSVQPAHRATVHRAATEIPTAGQARLVELIDELVEDAGSYFVSLTAVAGYAAKAELPLAAFYRRTLAPLIGGSFLDLLNAPGGSGADTPAGTVYSLDWINPPASGSARHERALIEARRRAAAASAAAERKAHEVLADRPKLLRRFAGLLDQARRFGALREEQARELTLAWPALRCAIQRLGEELARRGTLATAGQVFYLTRTEVADALADRSGRPAGRYAAMAVERQTARERQRRLHPPLMLGRMPRPMRRMLDQTIAILRQPVSDPAALVGIPASAGTAAGPVRVVRSADDFAAVRPGDVLVAPITTPAWSPLFERVSAVVTDNGGIGAHASIVAREYGIPAVVGLGAATSLLEDGELVEVNGSEGYLRRL